MNKKFKDLELSHKLDRAIEKMGFEEMTPVQEKTFQPLMEGKDVLALAPTGTGKTCGFGVPILESLEEDGNNIEAVIICPTRELAKQTCDVLHALTIYMHNIKIVAIYGGEPIDRQIRRLKGKPRIIVATPGRIMDHLSRRTIKLDHIKTVVLDEADRMLDMGFRQDIEEIMEIIPEERQMLLFSATMSSEIKKIADKYLHDETLVKVEGESRVVDTIKQYSVETSHQRKNNALIELLDKKRFDSTIVFVRTKARARQLSKKLNSQGFDSLALHGDLNQNQRDKVMKKYKMANVPILVATDVASRGIDVKAVDAVINFDVPGDSDSYVHRLGRTGRANQKGVAYTFIAANETKMLRDIEHITNSKIVTIGQKE